MKTIHLANALHYYDGVQIFDAHDAIGGNYVGVLVDNTPVDAHRYLVVGTSPEDLQQFRLGLIDLRDIIQNRVEQDWFIVAISEDPNQALSLQPQDGSIPEDYLPDAGFFLHGAQMAIQPGTTRAEALARNNVVFELALEAPETARGHRIRAGTLSGILIHLQSLLKHAYAKTIQGMTQAQKQLLHLDTAALLDVVVPAAPGSFKIVLEATQAPNLFGGGEITRALAVVDEIASVASNPDQTLASAQKYSGHTASAYLRLLRYMVEVKVSVKYAWASPDREDESRHAITCGEAEPLVSILGASESLGSERVVLVGPLRKADLDNGTWRLRSVEDNRVYSGKTRPGVSLSHLVIDQTYRFVCDEEIEEITGMGREVRTLHLSAVSEVSGNDDGIAEDNDH